MTGNRRTALATYMRTRCPPTPSLYGIDRFSLKLERTSVRRPGRAETRRAIPIGWQRGEDETVGQARGRRRADDEANVGDTIPDFGLIIRCALIGRVMQVLPEDVRGRLNCYISAEQ